METDHIHILHIEDNPADAALVHEILAEAKEFSGTVHHAGLLSLGLEILTGNGVDIILLDLNLPDSAGTTTFQAVKESARDTPVIIMTGLNDEEAAIHAVREGAQDYLVKAQVEANLLVRSIKYAIEREKLSSALRQALDRIKTLSGLLPICAACKNIRDDQGFWHQVEEYVRDHSDAEFTHGLCPKCATKLYPEYYKNNGSEY
ncbi:MAG: response regulator [Desulfobulbaceae bacterium]